MAVMLIQWLAQAGAALGGIGVSRSTPAAARLGDTCKPVVNRLDSILATSASRRSAAIQGKRGAVASRLANISAGYSPAPLPQAVTTV